MPLMILFSLASCSNQNHGNKEEKVWHDKARKIRYQPEGNDFIITNGTRRFNRALYGSNTGFRVEAGDLPEFGLYLPGMGGNLKFGIIKSDTSFWLSEAKTIKTRYRAGSMLYEIKDERIGSKPVHLLILPFYEGEGLIVKCNIPENENSFSLFWAYGGATGKRFSRDGDLGADPESSFDLKPSYCSDNEYEINDNRFTLYYGTGRQKTEDELYENNFKPTPEEIKTTRLKSKKQIKGIVPKNSTVKIVDASCQKAPRELYLSDPSETAAVAGVIPVNGSNEFYFIIHPSSESDSLSYDSIPRFYEKNENKRVNLAGRIEIHTPDKFINPLGSALSIAADAIWESPSYLHGAVAWRMRLPGWRGAYAADWLGWHYRAEMHFNAYAAAQYTTPASGPPMPDPATHFSRQEEKIGSAIFTKGYISRNPGRISKPHHYDMNQVFIDQLLWHFRWTGDLNYAKRIWPVIERHLDWEKRCFDANRDGLYDAYASIWASDALQYSGGGVTYSSAYNYRANKLAAKIASLTGINPTPYSKEALLIKRSMNKILWMPEKGWYAEYQDATGHRMLHEDPGLWSVYHAIDAGVTNPFQAYQCLRYVDNEIPHIPLKADGLKENDLYTLSTSNWMPYTWSVNNVALAEVLNTALAYWQAGRNEEAYILWKSALIDYMYLGSSPGNFGQLSFYDAFRGELYRDFADPIGVAARTLTEGLFGIAPDALSDTLTIRPGWPSAWNKASFKTPDIGLIFTRKGNKDVYNIKPSFPAKMNLQLKIKASSESVKKIMINDKIVLWKADTTAVGKPIIALTAPYEPEYNITIVWQGDKPDTPYFKPSTASGGNLEITTQMADILNLYDPEGIFDHFNISNHQLNAVLNNINGNKTVFIKLHQGELTWWYPVDIEVKRPLDIISSENQPSDNLVFRIKNNLPQKTDITIRVGKGTNSFTKKLTLEAFEVSDTVSPPEKALVPGTNPIQLTCNGITENLKLINWQISSTGNTNYTNVDLRQYYNDLITNIFRNRYLSPRLSRATLQLPWQGIGDWCSYDELPIIDDSGLRSLAGLSEMITTPEGIPFKTVSDPDKSNIVFTSLWDNYPDEFLLPLKGKASHAYFLMAGSTNHMQSRFTNGFVEIMYTDGTTSKLELQNPETWWPIEQDYYEDGYAFRIEAPRPPRLDLKTGKFRLTGYPVVAASKTIKIDGGAATVLDLPLNPDKELQQLQLKTIANDVVIGLMAVTITSE